VNNWFFKIIFSLTLLGGLLGTAEAYTIFDNYWGGNPTSSTYANRDVIGDTNRFDVSSMEVTFSGSFMNIAITGNYFNSFLGGGVYNMRPGDLFISAAGWDMGGMTAPYSADTRASGQQWNYVFDLGDNSGLNSTGTGYLYALSQGTITESNIAGIQPPGTYTYRGLQEWAFTPDQTASNNPLATGSWVISGNQLIFSIDASSLSFSGESIGFHWTMQCGNDVIEGAAPVPEPSTMLLLGSGLVGLWGIRKKRKGHQLP
jgi:hypothetical protein